MSERIPDIRRKVPVSIHFIALLYVIEGVILTGIWHYTRVNVSPALRNADIVTLLLLLIPLISLWSIYAPNRYMRWFPLYSILLIWLVVVGIGIGLLHTVWLTDALTKEPGDVTDLVVGGGLTLGFTVFLSLWTLFAFLPARFIPSARQYIYDC